MVPPSAWQEPERWHMLDRRDAAAPERRLAEMSLCRLQFTCQAPSTSSGAQMRWVFGRGLCNLKYLELTG